MKDKNKIVIKESIKSLLAEIPGLRLAWRLSEALFGAGIKLRQKKALEWIEMVRDNPSIFTKQILKDEQFQNGFVFALEKYIRERDEKKRRIMKKIFSGFTREKDKKKFELEKAYQVLGILNINDLLVLKEIDKEEMANESGFFQLRSIAHKTENIYNLINAGILIPDHSARLGSIVSPYIKVTDFGRLFIKFVKN